MNHLATSHKVRGAKRHIKGKFVTTQDPAAAAGLASRWQAQFIVRHDLIKEFPRGSTAKSECRTFGSIPRITTLADALTLDYNAYIFL